MSLHPLVGHERSRAGVARSLASARLPRVLLLHGSRGIGKQRFGLWMGQLLLCDAPEDKGPCGVCRECRLALRLEHPDLLWYFPVKRPPSRGSIDRDREALEEARGEVLEHLRADPLQPSRSDEVKGLHLGTVRNLRREAARRPAMARRRLILVADAEQLVAQESSPEAANALLKILEEPPEDCFFVLTSSEPGRLLPTIRSRAAALYLAALPQGRVESFLREHTDATKESIERATRLSGGSIGLALGFLPGANEPGPLEVLRQESFHLLRAALGSRSADRFTQALRHAPSGARGLHPLLEFLGIWLRDLAAVATSERAPMLNEDARTWFVKAVRGRRIEAADAARCMTRVEEARTRASGNVNPQLLLNQLLLDLNEMLVGSRSTASSETR
ncbi:MAG: hypothetical protein WD013_00015 [Gemmatimonadota bacterium]